MLIQIRTELAGRTALFHVILPFFQKNLNLRTPLQTLIMIKRLRLYWILNNKNYLCCSAVYVTPESKLSHSLCKPQTDIR